MKTERLRVLFFLLRTSRPSISIIQINSEKGNGAQAGIRTRVLRATAAYTGPNYTTWAQAPHQYTIIQLINLSRKIN